MNPIPKMKPVLEMKPALGMRLMLVPCLCIALLLPACGRQPDPAAVAAAQAAADEQAAAESARQYQSELDQQHWELAKAYGDVLLDKYPGTRAAAEVRKTFDEVAAKAGDAREARRLAGLWNYTTQPVKGGEQVAASLYARDGIDVDGSGAKPVQLVFRDHPAWGRSAYLVLQAGDFACHGGCKARVKADDAAAKAMAAYRPETDEAIAMFIDDERALWRLARGSKTLAIEFPVKAGGTRTAIFEVGGLDGGRMPGWD